mgnify:CR=1 FL=1
MNAPTVRLAEAADLPAVCEIVNHYIATTAINFRTDPQTLAEWVADWTAFRARYPWLVAVRDDRVVGLAHAGPFKPRAAYDWCAEVTVYVAPGEGRRGIGRRLYERLFERMDAQGFRSQVAVIALPNDPSVALHEAFGFRHAGTLRGAGYKLGAWRDVGFWQRSAGVPDEPARPLAAVT